MTILQRCYRLALFALAGALVFAAGEAAHVVHAQQKGKFPGGGKVPKLPKSKKFKLQPQPLSIVDVKAEGEYGLPSLFPVPGDQPRLGVTETHAYRLLDYSASNHCLRFVVYDFSAKTTSRHDVPLPKEVKPFTETPRVAEGGGEICVVSFQAQVLFVNPVAKKVEKVFGAIDTKAPVVAAPKKKKRAPMGKPSEEDAAPTSGMIYHTHGLAGGQQALSVGVNYDSKGKKYVSSDAMLYRVKEKPLTLKWSHDKYGVPPSGKDAVFGQYGDEIVVLTTRPKKAGAFKSEAEINLLVFDAKSGSFKTAQTNPDDWSGDEASTFMLSPSGTHVLAKPFTEYTRYLIERGTWAKGYKTDAFDPCVGFSHCAAYGIFLENIDGKESSSHVALVAIEVATGRELWRTRVGQTEARGNGENEPFTSVGTGAKLLATHFGIVKGDTASERVLFYEQEAVQFVPLAITFDNSGKLVAALLTDRLIVLDAKTRTEKASIMLASPLPTGAMGEFIAFSKDSNKVMACVRNQQTWLFDLATSSITTTIESPKGQYMRPNHDLSGVLYSVAATEGGNLMLRKFGEETPTQLYKAEYENGMAVCLWAADDGKSFLITEKGIGGGNLCLINHKGDKIDEYNVADMDANLVGEKCIMAFVTKQKRAVLMNEATFGQDVGVNCSVLDPGKDNGDPLVSGFYCVVKTADLPGSSAYGATAASPFWAGQYAGDDKKCMFACPAGVLVVDVTKTTFTLHAWSRKPAGLAALSPKGKDFFVAGAGGLTSYTFKP